MDSIPEQSAQPLLPAKVSVGVFTALVRHWFARFCRFGGVFIGLVTFALFYHIAGFGFLNWGDAELATDMPPVLLGIFPKGIAAAFQSVTPWDGNFGPLATLSHALDFQLFRNDPMYHHLTSLWLHIFNIILLFAVVRQFGKSVWVAALAAAIFALHPLQVAPVVSGRLTDENILAVLKRYQPEQVLLEKVKVTPATEEYVYAGYVPVYEDETFRLYVVKSLAGK